MDAKTREIRASVGEALVSEDNYYEMDTRVPCPVCRSRAQVYVLRRTQARFRASLHSNVVAVCSSCPWADDHTDQTDDPVAYFADRLVFFVEELQLAQEPAAMDMMKKMAHALGYKSRGDLNTDRAKKAFDSLRVLLTGGKDTWPR